MHCSLCYYIVLVNSCKYHCSRCHFQNLPNLIILDLFDNPVSLTMENYRLFIIYHLKTLMAFDGMTVVSEYFNILSAG